MQALTPLPPAPNPRVPGASSPARETPPSLTLFAANPAGSDIRRWLDPEARFAALHHDLPQLRAELGPARSEQLEAIVGDLLEEIAWSYRRELAQVQDYDGYRRFLQKVSLVTEGHFRADRRVWRDLQLGEATLQRIVCWLKVRLVAHLEIRR